MYRYSDKVLGKLTSQNIKSEITDRLDTETFSRGIPEGGASSTEDPIRIQVLNMDEEVVWEGRPAKDVFPADLGVL